MNNKKGFTLVELLVVIALIGLLIAIAVPSGFAISKKIKQKMLESKIEMIEKEAIVWGQQNKSEIKKGNNCLMITTGSSVTSCTRKTLSYLLEKNAIEPDETKENEIIKNPINNKNMNGCSVEIYIKNKRVYAKYDTYNSTCYYSNYNENGNEVTYSDPILLNNSLLRSNILNDTPLTTPGQEASTSDESLLLSTEDDYGVSYYFRGNVTNNYLNYSGMCWRIVRILGNGTIKLALADENGTCDAETYSVNNSTTAFINNEATYSFNSNGLMDYQQGDIPNVLETWAINKNLATKDANGNVTYDDSIALANWCNDTAIKSKSSYGIKIDPYTGRENTVNEQSEADEGKWYTDLYYAGYERLHNKNTATPTLKCTTTGIDSTTATTFSSNIAMLTADEVAFAGSTRITLEEGISFLQTNSSGNYWTLTPSLFYDEPNYNYVISIGYGGAINTETTDVSSNYFVRPAIVLKSNIEIKSKNDTNKYGEIGSYKNPYIVVE